MECEHCCNRCSPANNNFMDMLTFKRAVSLSDRLGSRITIGGGEPTLHKDLKEMVSYLLTRRIEEEEYGYIDREMSQRVFDIVTNGSIKSKALWLLSLGLNGFISVNLSMDYFHDISMVSEDVIEAFKRGKRECTSVGIRNVEGGVKATGRALDTGVYDMTEGCVCPVLMVLPDGNIKMCGCETSPVIGNVRDEGIGDILEDLRGREELDYLGNDCYKSIEPEGRRILEEELGIEFEELAEDMYELE